MDRGYPQRVGWAWGEVKRRGLYIAHPLPEGKALVVGLASRLEIKGIVVGQAQLHLCSGNLLQVTHPLQQVQGLPVMVYRLLVGIEAARPISRLE